MSRLILNDGQTIMDGRAGLANGMLWMWLPGYTMQAASAIAFNPEATRRVIYRYGENLETTYSGFTECNNIMIQEQEIAVCLKRGNDEDV